MPNYVDISHLGDKRLDAKLRKLDVRVQKSIVRRGLREAAKIVLESARANVPVDTGALRDGLTVRAAKARRGEFGMRVSTPTRAALGIEADAKGFYPAVIEYGSENHAPRPYLRPALDQNRDKAKSIIAASVRAEIEAIAA